MFAGPNGSGKSTITLRYRKLPDFPQIYINPDEIALSLGGDPLQQAYEASKIAEDRRNELIQNKTSFAFETVMSHPSKLALLENARKAGFETTLFFISTDDPKLNVERVRDRVADGGHDVPEGKIIKRYERTHNYLPSAIELAHRTYIFDNTTEQPVLYSVLIDGNIDFNKELPPLWIEEQLKIICDRAAEKQNFFEQIDNLGKTLQQASIVEAEYRGTISSIGKYYAVQETSSNKATLHDLNLVNDELTTLSSFLIQYENGVSHVESIDHT